MGSDTLTWGRSLKIRMKRRSRKQEADVKKLVAFYEAQADDDSVTAQGQENKEAHILAVEFDRQTKPAYDEYNRVLAEVKRAYTAKKTAVKEEMRKDKAAAVTAYREATAEANTAYRRAMRPILKAMHE